MSPAKLPLRVRPADHEPAYGLLDRIALRHGAASTLDFLCNIPSLGSPATVFLKRARGGRATEDIAAIAGMPFARLAEATFVRSGVPDGIRRPDLFLSPRQSRLGLGRVCAACIREDLDVRAGPEPVRPHRRVWWDLSAVRCCPLHSTPLTTDCPACNRLLRHMSLSPRYCPCGFDFSRHMEEPMPKDDLQADVYLVSRVIRAALPSGSLLDPMPLDLAEGSMMQIGRAAAWGAKPPPVDGMATVECAATTSSGFRALMDLPGKLVPILDALVAKRSKDSVPKVASYYGALYIWLWKSEHPSLTPLKDIMARHAASAFPKTGAGGVFGSESLPQERITFGEAARRWNLRYPAACNVAGLVGLEVTSQRRMQEITMAEYARVQAWLATHVGFDEARAILGVSVKVFYNLQEAGLIGRVGTNEEVHRAYYERAAIERFVTRASGDASRVKACPTGCATLVGVSRPFRGVAEIVRALLDGKLEAAGLIESKRGVGAIVVRSADISRLFTGADDGMVTGVEAANMLSMSTTETITRAIERGLLSATYPGGSSPKAGRLLRRAEVIEFDKRYAVAGSLGKLSGLSTRAASTMLRWRGVAPVFTGKAQGTLYIRAEAERALKDWQDEVTVRVRRSFSASFKAEAVARLEGSGEGVSNVAKALDLSIGQLCAWRRKKKPPD